MIGWESNGTFNLKTSIETINGYYSKWCLNGKFWKIIHGDLMRSHMGYSRTNQQWNLAGKCQLLEDFPPRRVWLPQSHQTLLLRMVTCPRITTNDRSTDKLEVHWGTSQESQWKWSWCNLLTILYSFTSNLGSENPSDETGWWLSLPLWKYECVHWETTNQFLLHVHLRTYVSTLMRRPWSVASMMLVITMFESWREDVWTYG